MSYQEFLATVRARGAYPGDEAEHAVRAVVTTLGERLPAASCGHLADQLPTPLDAYLRRAADGPGRGWGVSAFVHHVARRAGEDEETAATDTRVVCSAVAEQVSGGEMNKLLSQLPSGYAEFFGYSELAGP